MKIRVNGKDAEIEGALTLLDFLRRKGINPAAVIVEHNYAIPRREDWEGLYLQEGDNLEIVKFMGGG